MSEKLRGKRKGNWRKFETCILFTLERNGV